MRWNWQNAWSEIVKILKCSVQKSSFSQFTMCFSVFIFHTYRKIGGHWKAIVYWIFLSLTDHIRAQIPFTFPTACDSSAGWFLPLFEFSKALKLLKKLCFDWKTKWKLWMCRAKAQWELHRAFGLTHHQVLFEQAHCANNGGNHKCAMPWDKNATYESYAPM